MLKKLFQSWRENGGNLLLVVAAVTAAVVCSLWYFDLLPNIELEPPSVVGNEPAVAVRRPMILIATVIAPLKLETNPTKGFVHIYSPVGQPSDDNPPILTRPFEISEGGVASVAISELPSGRYAIAVFLDSNSNSKLDFDNAGNPVELLRTNAFPDSSPTDLDLFEGSVFIEPGKPYFVTFYLDEFTSPGTKDNGQSEIAQPSQDNS